MKRKRGSAKRKPPKKLRVAAAHTEPANSAFLNAEDYSRWDGNDGSESRMEAETAHPTTTLSSHHTGLQEAGFLEEMDAGISNPNANLMKNVASFEAKLSRAVGSSSVEATNASLPFCGDKMHAREPRDSHLDLRYDEQELNDALSVIKKIMKMDAAKPFNLPVDPKALGMPDYFDVIDTPMDFGTICNNLEWGGKYRNSKDVYKDVQLIWDNCSKYNKKGDYILELMKRVKINFIKHWNAAGLCKKGQEVEYVHLENLHDATEFFKRQNKCGDLDPSGSMVSNSIHQEQQDFPGLCQVQQQQCPPCFSHTQSRHLHSQCQCEWQSLHPHCSSHLATSEPTNRQNLHAHMYRVGPISGIHNSPQQDEIGPHKELSHQPSPNYGSKCHPHERPCKHQSSSSHHHHHLTKPLGTNTQTAGHFHLPFHGVSSSSACKKCEHTCSSVPVICNVSNPNHYEMCSCNIHEHQSLLRYSDQYQPHQKCCEHHSNSSEMLNNERDSRDAVEGVNPHVHSPLGSTVRHTKGRLGNPSTPATDHSNHKQQCQNRPSQVQPSSVFHRDSYQLQGNSSQCHFNVGLPDSRLPQDRTNIGAAEHSHVPASAGSTVRLEKWQPSCSGTPVSDDCSDQEECPLSPRRSQSPSLGHSDQPREHDVRHQPTSSTLEPSTPQAGAPTHNADPTSLVRKTRGRGPTRCLKLLDEGKRIPITTNELGQPVGVDAPKLISFLGILARNGHMAPLTFVDWRAMPEEKKENMWQEVQARFEIDPNSKTWVIKSLSRKWKDWKSKLKTAHYITHTTDEERLADRDERVHPDQWAYLVSHWSSELAEKRSARNKANRAKQKFGHITGTKSFARIREEQRVKRPDGKAPSRAELFILTRTRKDGKPVNDASSSVITQLREIANQQSAPSQNSTAEDEVFSEIIGRDTRGRVRCYGLGPSPSEFSGANPTKAEAVKMAAEANSEVRQMKERLVAMEQTCAQMSQQMAAMMSMMSSMQKNSRDDNVALPEKHT